MLELSTELAKESLTFEQMCDDPEVTKHILKSLRARGKQLGFSKKELPVAITLVTAEWTPDNGLLTAAMKMKRKQVNDFYKQQIKLMFSQQKD